MIEENPGKEERGTDSEDSAPERGREVVDASAWTDQRGTDDGRVSREPAQPASTAVVGALADRYGTSELDLYPPLYESIDPDALDRFLACSDGEVRFDYRETTVTVDYEYNVSVSDYRRE